MKRFATITALSLCLSWTQADAIDFSIKAVRLNDAPIEPTSEIVIAPGDVIDCDVYVSNWAEDARGTARLQFVQAVFSPDSFVNDQAGGVLPVWWDAPRYGISCVSDTDCDPHSVCRNASNDRLCRQFPTCARGASCPDEFPQCVGWTSDIQGCAGPDHLPQSSIEFIDTTRPDFLFADPGTGLFGLFYKNLGLAFQYASFSAKTALSDDGELKYIGSVPLRATTAETIYGAAAGEFEIRFRRSFTCTLGAHAIVLDEDGTERCARGIDGNLQSLRVRVEDPDPPPEPTDPIPATSTWGLVVLTLGIVIIARLGNLGSMN